MMCFVSKVGTFLIFCVFFIYICIWGIGSNSAIAQNYFSFPTNPLYGNLFSVSQGMPVSGSLFTSNYQFGQVLNPFASNLNPNFGIIPAGYYSSSIQTKEMVKGELIINLSDQVQIEQHANGPKTNMPELNALLEQYGVYEIEASSSGEFYVLKFSKSHDVNDVRKAFENVIEYVNSAEPNYIRKAHSTTPSFNTMMGGMMGVWSPQVSSFSGQSFLGQGFSYPGTLLNLGSLMPTTQPYYSGFPFSQLTSSAGLTYGSSWQNQGLSFIQPSISTWQQTPWGMQQQPY